MRAVLVTPHHQFSTATVMSQLRRARLAELALKHRFAITWVHAVEREGVLRRALASLLKPLTSDPFSC